MNGHGPTLSSLRRKRQWSEEDSNSTSSQIPTPRMGAIVPSTNSFELENCRRHGNNEIRVSGDTSMMSGGGSKGSESAQLNSCKSRRLTRQDEVHAKSIRSSGEENRLPEDPSGVMSSMLSTDLAATCLESSSSLSTSVGKDGKLARPVPRRMFPTTVSTGLPESSSTSLPSLAQVNALNSVPTTLTWNASSGVNGGRPSVMSGSGNQLDVSQYSSYQDLDTYSTDEELCQNEKTERVDEDEDCMEAAIASSQEMIENLSVSTRESSPVYVQLCGRFVEVMSEQDRINMKNKGLWKIDLNEDEVILGRDAFRSVFGERINGVEVAMLSRRHCVFRAIKNNRKGQAGVVVEIENTSTNGVEINEQPLAQGEKRRLAHGDVVTLLRFPTASTSGFGGFEGLSYMYNDPAVTSMNKKVNQNRWRSSPQMSSPGSASTTTPKTFRIVVLMAAPVAMGRSNGGWIGQHGQFQDAIAATVSPWLSRDGVQVEYGCATLETFADMMQSSCDIAIFAGEEKMGSLLLEDMNGNPSEVNKDELLTLKSTTTQPKLILVFSETERTANVIKSCEFGTVIFIESKDANRVRALCYLKSLLAGLFGGFPTREAHNLAAWTALHDLIPFERAVLGKAFQLLAHTAALQFSGINRSLCYSNGGQFIPLCDRFVGREAELKDIISSLRSGSPKSFRLCALSGHEGCGKSAIAITVAAQAHERRWYRGGVHFVAVPAIISNSSQEPTREPLRGTELRTRLVKLSRVIQDLFLAQISSRDSYPALLILDGCDQVISSALKDYISNLLLQHTNLQVLVTSQPEFKLNNAAKQIVEYSYAVKPLSKDDATKLLLTHIRQVPKRTQLKKSHIDWKTNEVNSLVAEHPALLKCMGNPSLIIRLANELESVEMDDLV